MHYGFQQWQELLASLQNHQKKEKTKEKLLLFPTVPFTGRNSTLCDVTQGKENHLGGCEQSVKGTILTASLIMLMHFNPDTRHQTLWRKALNIMNPEKKNNATCVGQINPEVRLWKHRGSRGMKLLSLRCAGDQSAALSGPRSASSSGTEGGTRGE